MSDKLEHGLQRLLQDPIEQHFEPLDEFTTYRLAAQAVKASHATPSQPSSSSQHTPSHRSPWMLAAAAAATLLIGGVIGSSALPMRAQRAPQPPATVAAVAIAPTQASSTAPKLPLSPAPSPAPTPQATPAAMVAAPTELDPVLAVTPIKPKRSAPRPPSPPQEVSAPPRQDATWWIERAGAFELEQDWAQAEHAYKQAILAKPEPTTLSFAHVALGNIYQRHLHKPEEALKHYEGYLSHAHRGALAQEALLGSIWALNALDRPLDEARQIKRLLKAHPQSPSAQALKARLQEIYAPTLK